MAIPLNYCLMLQQQVINFGNQIMESNFNRAELIFSHEVSEITSYMTVACKAPK